MVVTRIDYPTACKLMESLWFTDMGDGVYFHDDGLAVEIYSKVFLRSAGGGVFVHPGFLSSDCINFISAPFYVKTEEDLKSAIESCKILYNHHVGKSLGLR